jgi:hypothetical protein
MYEGKVYEIGRFLYEIETRHLRWQVASDVSRIILLTFQLSLHKFSLELLF